MNYEFSQNLPLVYSAIPELKYLLLKVNQKIPAQSVESDISSSNDARERFINLMVEIIKEISSSRAVILVGELIFALISMIFK
jgi:hypothetical protein